MARSYATLGVMLFVLIGCQPPPGGSTPDAMLPPPSFDAPQVAEAPAPPPAPPSRPVRQQPTAPRPAVSGPAEWAPRAPARNWRWIVIHHSATRTGSADVFDRLHRDKGWDELGYHFVIGNGTDSRNGQIEVGSRWRSQKWGAHARTEDNRFNDYGIGICLVGNFEVDRPTREQIESLARLTAHLMETYRISPDRVIGHGDTRATDCPGRHLSVSDIRRRAVRILAEADEPQSEVRVAGAELARD